MEYTWTISALECKVKDGELDNVIYIVHWRLGASNGLKEDEEIKVDTYGGLHLESPTDVDFVPYDQITKEQVIGWLESKLDVNALKEGLNNQIDVIANPISVVKTEPFK
jgi:hypothetical protein